MKIDKKERTVRFFSTLNQMGFTYEDSNALLIASKALSAWAVHECNGTIQRDDSTNKPFWVNDRTSARAPTGDREAGALRRVKAIMERHPKYEFYHQTDPRGVALYLMEKDAIPKGQSIDSVYHHGIAICI